LITIFRFEFKAGKSVGALVGGSLLHPAAKSQATVMEIRKKQYSFLIIVFVLFSRQAVL
jgi:hypothetical protein